MVFNDGQKGTFVAIARRAQVVRYLKSWRHSGLPTGYMPGTGVD